MYISASERISTLLRRKCIVDQWLEEGPLAALLSAHRFLPDQELNSWFNKIDCCVLPFQKIQNSGSVILAMGYGKPIISLNNGAVGKRLKQQQQLLYNNTISEVKLDSFTKEKLKIIGKKNLTEVNKYKWEDIKRLFE